MRESSGMDKGREREYPYLLGQSTCTVDVVTMKTMHSFIHWDCPHASLQVALMSSESNVGRSSEPWKGSAPSPSIFVKYDLAIIS
jgi:hypothetical protein